MQDMKTLPSRLSKLREPGSPRDWWWHLSWGELPRRASPTFSPSKQEPATLLVLPSQILVAPMILVLFNIDEEWLTFSCSFLTWGFYCSVCLFVCFSKRSGNNLGVWKHERHMSCCLLTVSCLDLWLFPWAVCSSVIPSWSRHGLSYAAVTNNCQVAVSSISKIYFSFYSEIMGQQDRLCPT